MLAFQWKNLILYTFSFNWKIAAATATTSFNHGRLRGAGASTELPGVVACTCNPATLEAEFRNGMGSIPVGGNGPSIGGWIV